MNVHTISLPEWVVLAVGFGGQALFSARFVIQWLASERAGRSVMPDVFWYFSLAGGATLFVIGTVHAGAYRVAVPPLPGYA